MTTTALKTQLPSRHHRLLNDYVAGRAPVVERDVVALAATLALPAEELSRPLTDEERVSWDFYRRSAANRAIVWGRAKEAWSMLPLRQNEVARLMGLTDTVISYAAHGRTKHILAYPPAVKLADACGLPDGAATFVMGLRLDGLPASVAAHSACSRIDD